MSSVKNLLARLFLDNKDFDQKLTKSTQSVRQFEGRVNTTGKSVGAFQGEVQKVGAHIGKMASQFALAAVAIKGIDSAISAYKQAVKVAIDFEAANSKLAAVLGTNLHGIEDLTAGARRLGATTSATASEVTQLQTELAKLGFTKEDILASEDAVLKFAKATGAELGEAASVTGAALRMFNASTSETLRYVSALAVGTTKSALSFQDYASSLATIGPVANSFGFTIEDTIALMGKLKDAGFDASSAATAARNIILYLADSNSKLSKKIGFSITSLDDLSVAFNKLDAAGIDLGEALQVTDKRAVSAFSSLVKNGTQLKDLRDQVTGAEGDFMDMSATMTNNVAGAIKSLESAWEGFELTIASSTGWIKSFIDGLTGTVNELRRALQGGDLSAPVRNEDLDAREAKGREQGARSHAADPYIQMRKNRIAELKKMGKSEADAIKLANHATEKAVTDDYNFYVRQYNKAVRAYNEQKKLQAKGVSYTRQENGKTIHVGDDEGVSNAWKEVLRQREILGAAKQTRDTVMADINRPAATTTTTPQPITTNKDKNLQERLEREQLQQAKAEIRAIEQAKMAEREKMQGELQSSLSKYSNVALAEEEADKVQAEEEEVANAVLQPFQVRQSLYDQALQKVQEYKDAMQFANAEERSMLQGQMEYWQQVADGITQAQQKTEDMQSALRSMGSIFGSLGGLAQSFGSKMAGALLQGIGDIADMIVQLQSLATANGVANAMKLPWPASLAAVATVIATVASVFSRLGAFESGGILGGSSYSGDRLYFRGNAGEAIINQADQKKLFDSIHGTSVNSGVNGQPYITGEVMYLGLSNYMKETGKKL